MKREDSFFGLMIISKANIKKKPNEKSAINKNVNKHKEFTIIVNQESIQVIHTFHMPRSL